MKWLAYLCCIFLPPMFSPWSVWYLDKPLHYTPYPMDGIFKINGKFYLQSLTEPGRLYLMPDDSFKLG